VRCPRSVEGSRQQSEIRLGEFLSPPEQAHDDKEISIGKKRIWTRFAVQVKWAYNFAVFEVK
jgi:hypothetical protein